MLNKKTSQISLRGLFGSGSRTNLELLGGLKHVANLLSMR
jgi:hypothetical protein